MKWLRVLLVGLIQGTGPTMSDMIASSASIAKATRCYPTLNECISYCDFLLRHPCTIFVVTVLFCRIQLTRIIGGIIGIVDRYFSFCFL